MLLIGKHRISPSSNAGDAGRRRSGMRCIQGGTGNFIPTHPREEREDNLKTQLTFSSACSAGHLHDALAPPEPPPDALDAGSAQEKE